MSSWKGERDLLLSEEDPAFIRDRTARRDMCCNTIIEQCYK